jgi:hypothetical protein
MAMSADRATVATKKPQVTAYVRDEVNIALDRAAADDQRSRSQMAALLIEEALRARGYLPARDSESNTESE